MRHEPKASASAVRKTPIELSTARLNKKGVEGERLDKTHYVRVLGRTGEPNLLLSDDPRF
jgi:hypothetical protein